MATPVSTRIYNDIITGLRSVGYEGSLIEENYGFTNWFDRRCEVVSVEAAAFGQTPVSYDSACIGVVCANGLSGRALVNRCRSLGAPFVLEINGNTVNEWAVSRTEEEHQIIASYPASNLPQMFVDRRSKWQPGTLLRAKNIGTFQWSQPGLFDGMLPELEFHIQARLDPLLREALAETKGSYIQSTGRNPNPAHLFKLAFWLLTAKVFHDRRMPKFSSVGPDADQLISAVAQHYGEEVPTSGLLNREARNVAAKRMWSKLDFRNLSVEVLSQIWSTTLVDKQTRKSLGIHRTPRCIVKYIIDRIDFEHFGDDQRTILEPCCGSAVFLIGAMNALRLRQNLYGSTGRERHQYFVKHLVGVEKDPFGLEISRLALTLADFPNPDGWNLTEADVFDSDVLKQPLGRAGVVLCNPPFEKFDADESSSYGPAMALKPAELLHRVLNWLQPNGVLGFVLPRKFIDGRSYANIRRRLIDRYESVETTILPDKFFDEADSEPVLLIAKNPIPHNVSILTRNLVRADLVSRKRFEFTNEVSATRTMRFNGSEAEESLVVPELAEVWDFLINYPELSSVSSIHRGIEWNQPLVAGGLETGNRRKFVKDVKADGFHLGVPPRAIFRAFEEPLLQFLDLRADDARTNAYALPWEKPKAIVNKTRRSRGKWKMVSFPDEKGLACYQTFIGVWPETSDVDAVILSAVLNSPVANAFVFDHGGHIDLKAELIGKIPVPHLTKEQRIMVHGLVEKYRRVAAEPLLPADLNSILMEIDALILDGYRMPARIERQLLDFFKGEERQTYQPFPDYYPEEEDVYLNLSAYISGKFRDATADSLARRLMSR